MPAPRDWATYTGQVEQDASGRLWAVLYRHDDCRPDTHLRREEVTSLRAGRRRVQQMVLAAADDDMDLAGSLDRHRNQHQGTLTQALLPAQPSPAHTGHHPLV